MIINPLETSQYLHQLEIEDKLDIDSELLISLRPDRPEVDGPLTSTWLTLQEVHRLRDHLTSILQAAGVPHA